MYTFMRVSDELKKKLEIIDRWDFTTVVLIAMRDENVDENNIDELLEEYKKYMAVCLIESSLNHPMTDSVDVIWHAHILCTRDYYNFCAQVFGELKHHEPVLTKTEEDKKAVYDAFELNTRGGIKRVFGYVKNTVWKKPMTTCSDRKM